MSETPTARIRPPDRWWTILRWRIAIWLLYRGLAIAPDGSAAISLEDRLRDWGTECRMQWHLRYPHPEVSDT